MTKEEIPKHVRDELSRTQVGREAIQVIEMQAAEIEKLTRLLNESRALMKEVSLILKEQIKKDAGSWRVNLGL